MRLFTRLTGRRQGEATVELRVRDQEPPIPSAVPAHEFYTFLPLRMTPARRALLEEAKAKARANRGL